MHTKYNADTPEQISFEYRHCIGKKLAQVVTYTTDKGFESHVILVFFSVFLFLNNYLLAFIFLKDAVRIRKTVVGIRTAAVRIRYPQICDFEGPVRQSYDVRTTVVRTSYGCRAFSANCVETLRFACDRLAI